MAKLTEAARNRIEVAIAAAEEASRAELVAVIAERASEYRATGLAVSTLIAFFCGLGVWLFVPWSGTSEVLLAEFGSFLASLGLLEGTRLGDRLTPRRIKVEAARRLARACFLEQGLAGTAERNGILFFVALAEHHVEIIADRGLDRRVTPGQWQDVVDRFAADVKAGEVERGYLQAITALSGVLAAHFPARGDARNELGNRLVEL
jgi:putative membrane protein